MKSEDLKTRIISSTNFLIQLNDVEIRTINENINFITWMLGFLSGGFILTVTNMKYIGDLLGGFTNIISLIFMLLLTIFILNIFLSIFYRLVSYKLVGKYIMNSNYLCSQKDLLNENLKLIPKCDRQSNVTNLILNYKLACFQYLDSDFKNRFRNETNPIKLRKIREYIFYLIVFSFIIEYIGIYFLFIKIVLK